MQGSNAASPTGKSAKARSPILDLGPIVLLIATLGSSCGAWHWLLDLASHFRWYYFAIGLIWLAGICRQRRRVPLWSLAIGLAWNSVLLAPYYLPARTNRPPGATAVSLISLNIHTANANKSAVIEYLKHRQPDVIVLLEVDAKWGAALQELNDLYPHRLVEARADYFGIALLSRWPLDGARLIEFGGTGLPSIVAHVQRGSREFQIVATHPVPPIGGDYTRRRNAQLFDLGDFVKGSPLPTIVAGDFNTTPWSFAFRGLLARSGLKDGALGHGLRGTWNARSWFLRIPIDHVLVPPDAVVDRRVVGPDVGSDHFPIETTIVLK